MSQSEYVPSTAEVVEGYVRLRNFESGSVAGFARWLAAEQARIWDEGAQYVIQAHALPGDSCGDSNPYRLGDGA